MKKILFCLMVLATGFSFGQTEERLEVINGAFERTHYKNKIPVPLQFIREADVVYSLNIIRVVDLQQKQNLPLVHPESMLIDVILAALKSGELEGYLFEKDDFKPENAMSSKTVVSSLTKMDTFMAFDPITLQQVQKIEQTVFDPNEVVKYRIKEEWVFDKQTSTMQVRIIGIAPIMNLRSAGEIIDETPMFWAYYPALRKYLSATEMFNWKNDAAKLSFDDYFIKRLFASYIFRETNVRGLRIQDYASGKEALKESDRIKARLVDFEQALWEY